MLNIDFDQELSRSRPSSGDKFNLTTCLKIALFSLAVVFSSMANSQNAVAQLQTANQLSPSIEGYSPVSYFTNNTAEKGHEEFAVQHGGNTYFLTSAEQVELFNANPMKYRPRYKVCPYSLALGKKLPLDPTNFKVVDNTLLLFHKSDGGDGLKSWNASGKTDSQLIELADEQLVLLRF